jgi:hypothetical protein
MDFAAMIEPIARRLLGEPNRALSSKDEWRYGARGSLSIDLTNGTWFDFETNEGGGTLDLVTRETRLDGRERTQWLRDNGFEDGPRPQSTAKPNPAPKTNGSGLGVIAAIYDYPDEVGALLFQVVRYEPKDFRQRRPDPSKPDGWTWSVQGVRPVPYRLPEILERIDTVIFIVEGEKDVDRLWDLNVPATTNAGGAGKWRVDLNEFFRGADIVVVPDRDPQATNPKTGEPRFHPDGRPVLPGQDHAQDVAAKLNGIAKRVRVLELWNSWPDMPEKADISDWLDTGRTVDDLYALVDGLVDWIARVPSAPGIAPDIEAKTIDEVLEVFDRWLVLQDKTPLLAVLGTIAANYLPGDPVWLGVIAPPSSAKTEILNSLLMLPNVVQAATLTPAGLLSGTPKKQQAKGAQGGLLRQIGQFGIIVLKDFGSVLSMHTETRSEVLAAMRELFDGAWTRHLGTDGGRTLSWSGKLAMIFASTEVIDAHYAVIGAMGDRFLFSRMVPVEGEKQFERALDHLGSTTKQMRGELARAVAGLFAGRRPEPKRLIPEEIKEIGSVISLAVKLRGAVARDRYHREIEQIYGAEGTARIGLALERLMAGLDTLNLDRETAMGVIKSVALDSVPPLRRRAYECVGKFGWKYDGVETGDVAIDLGLPTNTVRRVLEDLAAHGLIARKSQGKGKADCWTMTE